MASDPDFRVFFWQGCSLSERLELRQCDIAVHRRQPQLVQGKEGVRGNELKALFQFTALTSSGVSTGRWRLDHPDQNVLPFRSFKELDRHFEWMHSSETCLNGWGGSSRAGKISAYWRTRRRASSSSRGGLDAVAVADVHAGGALRPSIARVAHRCPIRFTSSKYTLKAGSSSWITSTPSFSSARASWFSSSANASRELHLVAVILVGRSCRRWSWAGQGDLELAAGVLAREPGFDLVDRPFSLSGPLTTGPCVVALSGCPSSPGRAVAAALRHGFRRVRRGIDFSRK